MRAGWLRIVVASAAPLAGAPFVSAQDALPLAPIEVRDGWLLAQDRLALPATTPDLLPAGRTRVALDVNWGNDFGWDLEPFADVPGARRFLVDGEHAVLAASVRRGLGRRVDVTGRVDVLWRGGGVLDGPIDAIHSLFEPLGVRDNGRPEFPRGRLRVEGRDTQGQPLAWEGAPGAALGNAEAAARIGLTPAGSRWRAAVVARILLPTATGSFASSGVDLGGQLVAARRLGGTELFVGAGAARVGRTRRHGIEYARWQPAGFLAAAWRMGRTWSLHAQTSVAGRRITGIADYPGLEWYARLAVRHVSAGGWAVHGGVVENVVRQEATVDFSVFAGVERSF